MSVRTRPSSEHPVPVCLSFVFQWCTALNFCPVALSGVGLRVKDVSNVIIRNVKIEKVLADAGDAIGVQAASQVWIDHNDLSSDQDHDKD